jgi:hypothetical protein
VAYAPCCLGALGLEQEEKATYTPCCPGALILETLLLEKPAFSPCSPGALGLDRFEWEDSLMDKSFE